MIDRERLSAVFPKQARNFACLVCFSLVKIERLADDETNSPPLELFFINLFVLVSSPLFMRNQVGGHQMR